MCVQGPALLHTVKKENIENKMKKTYFSPEAEVVLLSLNQNLLAGSAVPEMTDPTDGPVPETDLDPEDDGGW